MSKKIPPEFVVSIAIRNEAGDVLERREFITYQGLLAMAHDQGLHEITTELLQAPSAANGRFAIVRASVKGKPGTFVGLGDASPENTSRRVVRHLVRVAETRAKARALRDLTNVGMVALEELGGTRRVSSLNLRPPLMVQQWMPERAVRPPQRRNAGLCWPERAPWGTRNRPLRPF